MYIKKYAVSDFTIFQFLLENTEQKWGHLSKTVYVFELTNAMEQSPS
jgi:predicted AAA+ superfamily ATPase